MKSALLAVGIVALLTFRSRDTRAETSPEPDRVHAPLPGSDVVKVSA
jgi:hypothetical protein